MTAHNARYALASLSAAQIPKASISTVTAGGGWQGIATLRGCLLLASEYRDALVLFDEAHDRRAQLARDPPVTGHQRFLQPATSHANARSDPIPSHTSSRWTSRRTTPSWSANSQRLMTMPAWITPSSTPIVAGCVAPWAEQTGRRRPRSTPCSARRPRLGRRRDATLSPESTAIPAPTISTCSRSSKLASRKAPTRTHPIFPSCTTGTSPQVGNSTQTGCEHPERRSGVGLRGVTSTEWPSRKRKARMRPRCRAVVGGHNSAGEAAGIHYRFEVERRLGRLRYALGRPGRFWLAAACCTAG